MVGFDSSRISFTGTQIQVDWPMLGFDEGTVVKLDVSTVPEPGTGLLVIAGLIGLSVSRR